MQISYEVQLVALALGLYVLDSTAMLKADEAMLVEGRKGKWQARFGFDRLPLGGRAVCVLNLLTPHRAAYRFAWQFDEEVTRDASAVFEPLTGLRKSAPYTLFAAFALFVLFPVAMLLHLGNAAVLVALALLYASIAIALAYVYRQRLGANLQGRSLLAVAFECLVCPPFGVNMIRHISLAQRPRESFISAAERLLDADGWRAVQTKCAARLDDAIEAEPVDSPRSKMLLAQRQRFEVRAEEP